MFDFSTYLSTYTAVLSAFFTMELLGYFVRRRQAKAQMNYQHKMYFAQSL